MLITRDHLIRLLALREERDAKAKAATEANAAVFALEGELINAAPNQTMLVKLDDGTLRAITTGDQGNEFVGVMVATPVIAAATEHGVQQQADAAATLAKIEKEHAPAAQTAAAPDRELMRTKLAEVAARAGADFAKALLANSGKAERLSLVSEANLPVLDRALDEALNKKVPAVAA